MRCVFNKDAPKRTNVSFQGDFVLPEYDWKYAPFDLAYRSLPPFFQYVVSQAPLEHKHKRVLLDVKVQHLTPDRESCIPGWHLDGPPNPLHPSRPEKHHLFIMGGAPTEFVGQSLVLWLPDKEDTHQKDLVSQIPEEVAVEAIGLDAFYTFDRFDWHRGVIADHPLTRVLIRVTETDIIQPVRHPVKPGVGAR